VRGWASLCKRMGDATSLCVHLRPRPIATGSHYPPRYTALRCCCTRTGTSASAECGKTALAVWRTMGAARRAGQPRLGTRPCVKKRRHMPHTIDPTPKPLDLVAIVVVESCAHDAASSQIAREREDKGKPQQAKDAAPNWRARPDSNTHAGAYRYTTPAPGTACRRAQALASAPPPRVAFF
jgi:hypothetical protein